MRKIIVTEFLTADGIMEAPGGGDHPQAGWTFNSIEFIPEAYAIKGQEQEEASAMLLGRVSFQEFAPVWPTMEAEFPKYNAMPKHVLTTTLSEEEVTGTDWQNCHRLTSLDEVRALRAEEGGPIYVHGSAKLAQSLAAEGLVDQYNLMTFPVILGSGKRLFAEGARPQNLQLKHSESFPNGIVLSVYEVKH